MLGVSELRGGSRGAGTQTCEEDEGPWLSSVGVSDMGCNKPAFVSVGKSENWIQVSVMEVRSLL